MGIQKKPKYKVGWIVKIDSRYANYTGKSNGVIGEITNILQGWMMDNPYYELNYGEQRYLPEHILEFVEKGKEE